MADYVGTTRPVTGMGLVPETRPLLSRGESTLSTRRNRHQRLTLIGTCIQIMVTCFGLFLEMAPQTAIFQDIICNEYYKNGSTTVHMSEADCKIEPVQSQVALVNGWKDTFDQVPGIFLAIPFGLLADRIGRKPVLVLSSFGYLLEATCIRLICWFPHIFPLRLIWLCPIFQCCGGGIQIFTSMLFTMLADVSTADQRTGLFSNVTSVFLLSQIIALPTSAAIFAKTGPWVPYILGLGLQFGGFMVAINLPETFHFVEKSEHVPAVADVNTVNQSIFRKGTASIRRNITELGTFINKEKTICIFVASIFIGSIAVQSQMNQLVLYVAKRFPWSIGQASILLSIKAFVYLLVLVLILPFIRKFLHMKYAIPATIVDINVARASALLLTLSCLLIGLAPHLPLLIIGVVLFALGSAFDLIARSLATLMVSPSHVAVLYTAIALVQSLGVSVAGPALALLWRWGMLLGEKWQGLPYLVIGSLLGVFFVALMAVSVPKSDGEGGEDGQEATVPGEAEAFVT